MGNQLEILYHGLVGPCSKAFVLELGTGEVDERPPSFAAYFSFHLPIYRTWRVRAAQQQLHLEKAALQIRFFQGGIREAEYLQSERILRTRRVVLLVGLVRRQSFSVYHGIYWMIRWPKE